MFFDPPEVSVGGSGLGLLDFCHRDIAFCGQQKSNSYFTDFRIEMDMPPGSRFKIARLLFFDFVCIQPVSTWVHPPAIHFYIMRRAYPVKRVVEALRKMA